MGCQHATHAPAPLRRCPLETNVRLLLHGQEGETVGQAERVAEWFSAAVGVRCWLVRQLPGSRHAVQQRQLQQQQGQQEQQGGAEAVIEEAGSRHSIGALPHQCPCLYPRGLVAAPLEPKQHRFGECCPSTQCGLLL